MRILITGAAGFIGSNLVEYHLNRGDVVYGVDDLSTGLYSNLDDFIPHPNFRFIEADITTWDDMERIVGWSERVYAMAAVVGVYKVLEEPERVLAVNIAGCERILQAVKATHWRPRVIIASSSEVYGPNSDKILSEDMNLIIEARAKNRWDYAISKLTNEAYAMAYYRKFSVPVTAVRLFNTIGHRQRGRYGMVVPRFINEAIHHKPLTVFGDGNQTRSFCDVRDIVSMLDALANTDKSIGEVVNVGNDREITINKLAELVKSITGSKSTIEHLSYEEAYGQEYFDIKRRRPDLKKLMSLINFEHQWTLEQSIQDIIAYNETKASIPT